MGTPALAAGVQVRVALATLTSYRALARGRHLGNTRRAAEQMHESVQLRSLSLCRSLSGTDAEKPPRGDYLVPLFIGDKQGLSRKQTVHVKVCSCPGGFTCAEPSVGSRAPPGGPGLSLCSVHSSGRSADTGATLGMRLLSPARGMSPRGWGADDGRGQRDAFENNP